MKLFAGLRMMRYMEAKHLPFVRSLVDFDIVIEIGYHEERGRPLSVKQLLARGIRSRTTVRRKLRSLIDQEIVFRITHAGDGRASLLGITDSARLRLDKYRTAVSTTLIAD
jgi:DNA-binding MarR family transcriptional regulator